MYDIAVEVEMAVEIIKAAVEVDSQRLCSARNSTRRCVASVGTVGKRSAVAACRYLNYRQLTAFTCM